MSSQESKVTEYLAKLSTQSVKNICPSCLRDGMRKKFCSNLVLLPTEMKMVCCYLGDKEEISKKAFKKKLKKFKKFKVSEARIQVNRK